MNRLRRDAIKKMAILMGASVLGPRLLANAFGSIPTSEFNEGEISLLDEIGESIIPATDIAGAKGVSIGRFIAMMVTDCYTLQNRTAFKAGLAQFAKDYNERYGRDFIADEAQNRLEFVSDIDREQRMYTAANRSKIAAYESGASLLENLPHYFRVLRELTVLGYFTSEVGSTMAVRYVEVPGRYDGDVPFKSGDRLIT